jgi:iron-sulfur cluster protein
MIKTAQDIRSYKKQLKEALEDKFLRTSLDNFNTAYRKNRPKVYEGLDFEKIKQEIAQEKDVVLPRLLDLFDEFRTHAEAAGAIVHVAKDALEANRIIACIAEDNAVKHIVKSKSMTAEEIFLNTHLEKRGFQVTETDLGEWIIQLRQEGPSHMVMPAIHLSRYQVGDLFEELTQNKLNSENIDELVKVARRELRPAFLEADMGISGANFAIADSGTLGLVTNEGNMRLVTTLPKVHVALVGFDKLLPDLQSALKILKLLPRNATGQILTSYVTWIKGANECSRAPTGKKELHIVFLDNGRLNLAKDPIFAEALRCIRCGACANVCPVYSKVGGHKYGHVYIGAIGLILTLFYHGRENDRAIVKNCLNCQACKAVCAVDIDLPFLIKKTLQAVLDGDGRKPLKNHLLSRVMPNRKLFHFLLRQAYLAQKPLAGKGSLIRHLPHFLEKQHGFRSLPRIAAKPFRDRWQHIAVERPAHRVSFFAGCAVDFIYPEQAEAMIELIKGRSVQVMFPDDQTCCGLPALMAAEEETAAKLAAQNIQAFQTTHSDYILTLCASCASHIKHYYPKLAKHEDLSALTIKPFVDKVMDFSSFMVKVLKMRPDEFRKTDKKVAYHSPCHLCRGLNVTEEPRKLIEIAGLKYTPSLDENVCCGFGGSYSVDFPEISAEILKQKLDNVEKSGAEILVTDCPGCVLQLRGGMTKRKGKIQVKHLAEALADQLADPRVSDIDQ